jgi:hypothetical protein
MSRNKKNIKGYGIKKINKDEELLDPLVGVHGLMLLRLIPVLIVV